MAARVLEEKKRINFLVCRALTRWECIQCQKSILPTKSNFSCSTLNVKKKKKKQHNSTLCFRRIHKDIVREFLCYVPHTHTHFSMTTKKLVKRNAWTWFRFILILTDEKKSTTTTNNNKTARIKYVMNDEEIHKANAILTLIERVN